MKRGVMLLIVLLMMSFVLADESLFSGAYDCLEDRLGDDCGNSQNTEQIAFSLLAMAGNSGVRGDCKSALLDNEKDDCWGKTGSSGCDLKSTAISVIALNHIGSNTGDRIDWILDSKKIASGLDWYLEIDTNNESECNIEVNGDEDDFVIKEDKTIVGSSSCLSVSDDGYFLKIKSSCYDENFTISCDSDFVSAFFYKQEDGDVYHLSGQTSASSAYDSIESSINSYCFTDSSGNCDYEESLWAVLALAKKGKDIKPYLAYLFAGAEKSVNKRYFPSAFLYMFTKEDEYYLDLAGSQKNGKYWEEGGERFYDTALALMALDSSSEEFQSSQNYLISIQDESGCWSGILDTAMIVFALNPSDAVVGGGGSVSVSKCLDFGFYCISAEDCSVGNVLDNYFCPGLGNVCCNVQPAGESCYEKGGIECRSDQECSGAEVVASDTNYCCLDSCLVVEENECENRGYTCRLECFDDEEEKSGYSEYCDAGICCSEKEDGGGWFWVIVLIILIILVILGIIFRKKLQVWFFKFKGGVKSKKAPGRPKHPPNVMPFQPRPSYPGAPRHPSSRVPSGRARRNTQKDKEFDDVMKKLKDMSK